MIKKRKFAASDTIMATIRKATLNDIPMLVSAINFLLRDGQFDDLDRICDFFHEDRKILEKRADKWGVTIEDSDISSWFTAKIAGR